MDDTTILAKSPNAGHGLQILHRYQGSMSSFLFGEIKALMCTELFTIFTFMHEGECYMQMFFCTIWVSLSKVFFLNSNTFVGQKCPNCSDITILKSTYIRFHATSIIPLFTFWSQSTEKQTPYNQLKPVRRVCCRVFKCVEACYLGTR